MEERLTCLTGRMAPTPERLLAGVSGGADSVALLLLLLLRGCEVTAVHVHHGLRGAAADGDEAFVRELCQRRGVPLLVFHARPPENPGEDWARRVRYGFFREAARQTGVNAVALAHHRDDQAETLLLRLMRGAGLTGLAGMAEQSEQAGLRLVRPLLDISRDELRTALTEAGQPWREDATNAEPRYLRNAVRLELLPLMERLAPGSAARISATAALLREEAKAADSLCGDFLRRWGRPDCLPLQPLSALPEAVARRVLRAWWRQMAGEAMEERELSRMQTDALWQTVRGRAGARCNLPGGWHGQRGWSHIHLLPPGEQEAPAPVDAADGAALCGIVLRLEAPDASPGDGRRRQCAPRWLLRECRLRTRRPGDYIVPLGRGGRQSLQDYLVNRRVDAPFRDRLPLLCRGSEVLLAAGVGTGRLPTMAKDGDMTALCWQGDMPWLDP